MPLKANYNLQVNNESVFQKLQEMLANFKTALHIRVAH